MKKLLFIILLIAAISIAGIVRIGNSIVVESEEGIITLTETKAEVEIVETNTEQPVIIEELEEVINYRTYAIPKNKGFKSYMDYRAITNKKSKQFQLQSLYTNTGDYGIRMVNDRYCIAVGTHFGTAIGQHLDLILENGTVIPCILADVKADVHTESNNIVTLHNGCVSEFVVDTPLLHNTAKIMGDISYCHEMWKSPVVEIVVYEQNVFNQ